MGGCSGDEEVTSSGETENDDSSSRNTDDDVLLNLDVTLQPYVFFAMSPYFTLKVTLFMMEWLLHTILMKHSHMERC